MMLRRYDTKVPTEFSPRYGRPVLQSGEAALLQSRGILADEP